MERWRSKVAVVTGASSGIGAATARLLLDAGVKVVGLDLLKEKGDFLFKNLKHENGQVCMIKTDVTNEEEVTAAFKWVKENMEPIHIIVNCAGVSRTTTLIDGNIKLWKEVIDTNIYGLCLTTREAVNNMKENKVDGHVIHMNSYAGHVVLPFENVNVYSGTKFAVTALAETLRKELISIKSRIKVTSISPGLVSTDMYKHNALASGLTDICVQRKKLLCAEPCLLAEDVANAVIYVLSTPPRVQIQELKILPVGQGF